jgi:hypothetical protein
VRQYIAAGIRLVVHLARLQGGARKVTRLSEIIGVENGTFRIEDIFAYRQTGVDAAGSAVGEFYSTGYRPVCVERLKTSGTPVDEEWFSPWVYPAETPAGSTASTADRNVRPTAADRNVRPTAADRNVRPTAVTPGDTTAGRVAHAAPSGPPPLPPPLPPPDDDSSRAAP